MMDTELTTWLLLWNAEQHHHDVEVVSRMPDASTHRYTYAEFGPRAKQLMNALDSLGLETGARVATLAWNSYRHLEAYFAVPCTGRVLHTLNLRLSPAELVHIMTDAEDVAVLVDADLVPLLELVAPQVPTLEHVIVMGTPERAVTIAGVTVHDYETIVGAASSAYEEPTLDERSVAGLCYTSGTTGLSKGVAYTHRSTVLHTMAAASAAGVSIGPSDCALPQVPMFHANAWGIPYAAVAVGAKLCLYGGALVPKDFVDLMIEEGVTVSAGVPTVWMGIADELERRGPGATELRHIVCGGSQPSRALIEEYADTLGITVVQAWGMTETSPLGSVAWPHHHLRHLAPEQLRERVWRHAGLPVPGVAISVRDEKGTGVPADGESMGALYVRGPWVADGYLHGRGAENFTGDGWFHTGDVAVVTPDGYFVIADRTKDLIKSGGEWISSVDMEAAIMAMPAVAEAAVIAVPHEKWGERPLACIVVRDGQQVTEDDVREHLLASGFMDWQLPDRIELIDEVPKTAVGKFDKKVLRRRLVDVADGPAIGADE